MPQSPPSAALAAAAVAAVLCLDVGPALAAGQRSFVSTSGVDNLACSIASTCRTFGAAVTATSAGGEVIVLDSGGYGPVTIAKSVSIIAPRGVYAGVSVTSGSGVTITTPAASDRVVLVGLAINNQGASGSGIDFIGAGRLEVARTRIAGFGSGAGLLFVPAAAGQGRLHAVDVSVSASQIGVQISGGATVSDVVNAVLEALNRPATPRGSAPGTSLALSPASLRSRRISQTESIRTRCQARSCSSRSTGAAYRATARAW